MIGMIFDCFFTNRRDSFQEPSKYFKHLVKIVTVLKTRVACDFTNQIFGDRLQHAKALTEPLFRKPYGSQSEINIFVLYCFLRITCL